MSDKYLICFHEKQRIDFVTRFHLVHKPFRLFVVLFLVRFDDITFPCTLSRYFRKSQYVTLTSYNRTCVRGVEEVVCLSLYRCAK